MRLIPVLLPCAGVFDHLHDYIRNRPDKEEYHQPSAQPIVRRLDNRSGTPDLPARNRLLKVIAYPTRKISVLHHHLPVGSCARMSGQSFQAA